MSCDIVGSGDGLGEKTIHFLFGHCISIIFHPFSFGHVNDSCFSLGLRSNETKRAFATLRALVEVMEALSKDTGPDGVGQLITEEVFIFLSSVRYFLCSRTFSINL